MNVYLVVILGILISDYLLGLGVENLNLRAAVPQLPQEFKGVYDAGKYQQAQSYLKENTRLGIINDTVFILIIIPFILCAGFNYVDIAARGFNLGPIMTGLIFAAVLVFASQLFSIPFSVYRTFVIEEKYGFNRTTPKTFILDILKGWLLTIIIGGAALAGVLWFFIKAGGWAWVYCWGALSLFQLFLVFIAPVVIMPLFNKFVPLDDGELKTAIENYARRQDFKLKGVFKMDGSKRSTKTNAFFTGFGRNRRIVLWDTLIRKHTVDELVSVLAHEMGHYKRKHIQKHIAVSLFNTGLMFFIFSFFINNPGLFAAFSMENISIYAGLFFCGFLYTPINMAVGVAGNILSRQYEYESDAYAVAAYRQPAAMISALKKLSVDNLSNLTPHPLKVFLQYSHPPVLKRIEKIRSYVDI